MTIVGEFFAGLIAKQMGLLVPDMRIVDYTNPDSEWYELKFNMKKFLEEFYDEVFAESVLKEVDRPTILVMDVLIGKDFFDLDKDTVQKFFCMSHQTTEQEKLETKKKIKKSWTCYGFGCIV